ncbi:hypothetical protein PHYBOEH_006998 [Phytophthora boehmeriae]|uniref:Uncharacterized protein n=1 Tax=Phytophthora boehmeriae TaxID=109152 RepID=A0A8T1X1G0_9STRA|nr:hypothetical protein PHYBOEH_006998 [Phytophthora boehmeriae]
MGSDDEGVTFQTNALDVVGSWLLGGDCDNEKEPAEIQTRQQRRPVTLYRPSSSASSSLPSLTRPNEGHKGAVLTEEEKEMKRKLLRKSPAARRAEQAVAAEAEAQTAQNEAQDQEEEELVRLKTQAKDDGKKRKRNAQEELLDKLREEAARKKAKNLKTKLRLQRKRQQQQHRQQQGDGVAAN